MILVRKNWMYRVKTRNKDSYIELDKILLPKSEKFKKILNVLDINSHYDKVMLKVGSVVKLSHNNEDYYFGLDESYLPFITDIELTIESIDVDGEIIFENPNNEKYLNPDYVNYGITEVCEIIKY